LAVLFIGLTQGSEMAAIFAAFGALPWLQKIAWAVIVLVPLIMLPFGVWLWDRLVRQQQSGTALERRLDGVRTSVKDAGKAQLDIDADIQQLTRSDPEDAIAALQRRVSEAERFAQIQQSRNAITDLDTRVTAIRTQQQALKDRLAPVLDTRHSIEQLFSELDGRHRDIERSLAEIASGDDGAALEIRLKNLTEFVRQGNARCDQIEQASKTLVSLSEAGAEMGARLAPFAAAEDGITSRVRRLGETNDRLATQIGSLERLPEGLLADRVQKFSSESQKLGEGIAHLHDEFSKLADLRKDVNGFVATFERALAGLSSAKDVRGAPDIDARIADVTQFVGQTQSRFDDIERRMIVFTELKARLGDLQTRLAPLESADSGVVKLVSDLQDILADMRKDVGGFVGSFERALGTLSNAKDVHGAPDIDGRIADVTQFIGETQNRFDDIERRVVSFTDLKGRLGDLQARLAPLESTDSGVVKLINDLQDIREKLIDKIRRVEGGEEGDLAARVRMFADTKRELEERVSNLTDQFTKLSTIRKDIAGLFDKLSSAVNGSAN
jgi:predicted  nucleic acid-binding Zn-ribbon protein